MRNVIIALFIGLLIGSVLQCGQSFMPTVAGKSPQVEGTYQATTVIDTEGRYEAIFVTVIDTRTGEVFSQKRYLENKYETLY